MRKRWAFTGLVGASLIGAAAGTASAAPSLRAQVAQRGDFILIGNTLAHDCAPGAPAPVVGAVGACGTNTADTAPDVFWRSDSPMDGQAEASTAVGADAARSTAVLSLPPGVTVTNAYLYWAARLTALPGDSTALLDRPGVFSSNLTALEVAESTDLGNFYQSVADVTSLVQAHGSGAYQVSGVSSLDLVNQNVSVAAASWWMVVFYRDPAQPPRNLALFDGLDAVLDNTGIQSTISGFVVPGSNFSAKLGVIAYDGDPSTGDALQWDSSTLSDALNPADNFFNATRSSLGAAVSIAGDLPQLQGTAQSMSGVDLDIVEIPNNLLSAGQTSATITAVSSADTYLLGGLVTSISTLMPDLSTSTKSVEDLNGGGVAPGDTLEYTIVITNTGDGPAFDVVMNDQIPAGVTYVPGSIQITAGPEMGGKSDIPNDDQGEYAAATGTVTVRVGTGATAADGGALAAGESTTVKFQVTVDPTADGLIENQAIISGSSALGGAPQDYPTDGNGSADGAPPTAVTVDSDDDGLSDGDESAAGTDPNDADSDDDGLADGDEPSWDLDSDGDGLIDAQDPDSDGDGLFDGTEAGLDCSNPATDAGAGHCIPDADSGATTTNPLDDDTDEGGVSDGIEDADHDGQVDSGETDPNDPADDGLNDDTDGDGLTDAQEGALGSDPGDQDTDDDGVSDGTEADPAGDADGDGTTNILDEDSDGDGLFDGTEMGLDCSNPGTDAGAGHCVPDADGAATTTDPLDEDTDDGGVSDGDEDADHDGQVDSGETDPNDPADDSVPSSCESDADCGGATSGLVCDDATGLCVEGCRGSGGNGCPSGEVCSSTDSTIGSCEAGGAGGGPAAEEEVVIQGGGCACSVPSGSAEGVMSWGLVAAGAAIAAARRRRRRGGERG